jgi:glycosyltransferase involved in cell wall biosynthesis
VTVRVTALTKYDREAASTRQRLLQFVPSLNQAGIEIDYRPLLGADYVRSLAAGSRFSKGAIARAYATRMRDLLSGDVGDVLWVYAELFPYMPAAFEKLAFRAGRPVIYDCDDAFFHQYDESPRGLIRAALGGKLQPLMKGAAACSCGNDYLADYVSRFCGHTVVIPTVVDTDVYEPLVPLRPAGAPITIGWIGSPSTFRYLRPVLPLLRELRHEFDIRFRVVGAGERALDERFDGMDLIPWREENEVLDVQAMHIGIMPLPDELWARGKSGYKLIQYMACGLPVVASPVGVNTDIVTPGVNGFLPNDREEWRAALSVLIQDAGLRRRMGAAGRERAVAHYSLSAHAPRMIELIRQVAGPNWTKRAASSK